MNVQIKEGCVACALCTTVCPAVFKLGEDGFSQVHGDPNGYPEEVKKAAEGCPAHVIQIDEHHQMESIEHAQNRAAEGFSVSSEEAEPKSKLAPEEYLEEKSES